ncbi:hypothetical protein Tsubulata_041562 [Turnera subulata]|uniref:F-box domain-containing protein n=1 Tax=Turnera subulata TaxID=218843 RepID=A0A9Q0G6V6_9ROSI|nr:hypothetical protein Tsubulata_041562 [Turnera subulata]
MEKKMAHQTGVLEDRMIREILLRLPVKSLCRFTSICKTWGDTFRHPDFKRDHVHRHLRSELMKDNLDGQKHNTLILQERPLSSYSMAKLKEDILHSMVYEAERETPVMQRLPLQLEFSRHSPDKLPCYLVPRLRGSCDGLVLITGHHPPHVDEDDATASAIILNPCTRETRRIPLRMYDEAGEVWGIGYDHLNCCHKVVRAPFQGRYYPVRVLSLKINSWKNTTTYTGFSYMIDSRIPVTANRCPHWTALNRDTRQRHIIYFDASEEDFRTVPLPTQAKDFLKATQGGGRLGIFSAGGNLGLCMNNNEKDVSLWWMKEHGVKESWAKLYNVVIDTLTFDFYDPRTPWCILKNGKVV